MSASEPDPIDKAIRAARAAAAGGDFDAAWDRLHPHADAVGRSRALSWAWLVLSRADPNRPPDCDAAERILATWPEELDLVELAAVALLDGLEDWVSHPLAARVADALRRCLEGKGVEGERAAAPRLLLATALRLAGPAFDDEAEALARALVDAAPDAVPSRFNLGLFYKYRARWSEGRAAFEALRELGVGGVPVLWNLALCATAAAELDAAVTAWRALDLDARAAPDGRPWVPGLGLVHVRVGAEMIAVHPRSPCHGVIAAPPASDVDVGYGDTVLWDAAPVETGDIPVFPMLARLERGAARCYRFEARPADSVEALAAHLPDAVWLHVHDQTDTVATGVVVVEPETRDPRAALDRALEHVTVELEVPELS